MPLASSVRRGAPTLAVLVFLAFPGIAFAGLANSAWPMFQHDAQHTGRTDVNGPQGPTPVIAWEFKAKSGHKSSPVVGEDGTLYVPNGKFLLVAVDPDTALPIWNVDLIGAIGKGKVGLPDRSQPAVSDTGTIYQGARDNNLWATLPNGQVDWFFHVPFDGDVTMSPTIAQDGTIYMGSEALSKGWFYAMNPDGTTKWADSAYIEDGRFTTGGSLKNVSAALNTTETRVFASNKIDAIAIDAANGDEIWRCEIADKGPGSRQPNFSPVVYNDGVSDQIVLFNSKDGLWAFDPNAGPGFDCTPLWQFVPPNPVDKSKKEEILSAAALGADGTIYVGASKGKKSSTLYALDPADGSIIWKHEHIDRGTYNNSQAAVGADGTVYVSHGKFVHAFDGAGDGGGGSVVKFQIPIKGKMKTGPIIGAPGVLYVPAGKRIYKVTD